MCRFIVRDFEYDPKVIASEAEERGKLELQIKKQFVRNTKGHIYVLRNTKLK